MKHNNRLIEFKKFSENAPFRLLKSLPQIPLNHSNVTLKKIRFNNVDPQVLFVADYATITKNDMNQFQVLKDRLAIFPHFLFLTKKTEFPESKEKTFNKLFKNGIPDYSFEMTFFNRNKFQSAIQNIITEKEIDLIVYQDTENIHLVGNKIRHDDDELS